AAVDLDLHRPAVDAGEDVLAITRCCNRAYAEIGDAVQRFGVVLLFRLAAEVPVVQRAFLRHGDRLLSVQRQGQEPDSVQPRRRMLHSGQLAWGRGPRPLLCQPMSHVPTMQCCLPKSRAYPATRLKASWRRDDNFTVE